MYDNPLYIEIMRDTKRGDRFSNEEVAARWGRTDVQIQRVLEWMSGTRPPQPPKPTVKRVGGSPPNEIWERL